ncbi:MAG: AsmA family protein, partial [Hyphomicrobiales bacterium]
MREALTVIGFLIIVAFSALLAAPLFGVWTVGRGAIAQQMAKAIGATVLIEGPIDARILPQPWLSVGKLTIGEPGGATTLVVEQAEADISLGALIRGSFDLSNVTLEQPHLTLKAGQDGAIAPLVLTEGDRPVVVENFQIGNG